MSDPRAAESLTDRIRAQAAREGIPPLRLRNRIAFQRMLARLAASGGWVLKGGFVLEVRLGLRARATKDLDLTLSASSIDASALQDLLDDALAPDLGDAFAFGVRRPRPVRAEEVEPSTWRVVVDVRHAGAVFGTATVDVVLDPSGSEAADELRVPADVVGTAFSMPSIDVHRHAAEKFHAYSRVYANDRPSSRVKDLVDLVLLADSGLLDARLLRTAVGRVFAERDTPVPVALLRPPGDWARTYAALAEETSATARTTEQAWSVAAELWARAGTIEGER